MARYTGPKHRLARREGANIMEKESASLARRLMIHPGMHGPKGTRRKTSEYGLQLREKQKAKRMYQVSESQFARYVSRATGVKGKTGEALLQLLETRLDNMVFRLKFVPSRFMSRQLVSHGHVQVNGKTVNIPSYTVKVGDVISLSTKAQGIPAVMKMLELKETNLPEFVERKAAVGKLVSMPNRDQIKSEIDEQLIVEYYSR